MQIKLQVSIIKRGKKYVAYSPALDLSTSGNNLVQAKKRFSELVDVFFSELDEKHTLETVLVDLGWTKEFLEAGLKDSFGSLDPLTKEEYDYYMSLPDKRDVETT